MSGDEQSGQTDAGGSVSLARLANQAGRGHLRKLSADGIEQPRCRDDHDAVGWHEPLEALKRVFQKRRSADQRQQLLGKGSPAGGPKAGAGAAGHHDRVEHADSSGGRGMVTGQ
jgi:hypothetical protein